MSAEAAPDSGGSTDDASDDAGAFDDDGATAPADATDTAILLTVDDATHRISLEAAVRLRESIGRAVERTDEFVRTAGRYRPDGRYEVRRRGTDAAGNAVVFDDFAALRALYERLPATVTAEAVGAAGQTGSRRHLLVRHFAEHPSFDCELTRRRPLTAEKRSAEADRPADGDASSGRATSASR